MDSANVISRVDQQEGVLPMIRTGTVVGLMLWTSLSIAESNTDATQSTEALLVQSCAACHGPEGQGVANFPRLAGLGERYLLAQLDAFASGKRDNAIMKPLVVNLTHSQKQALAEHFSALPVKPAQNSSGGSAINDAGRNLALHGRWDEGIPACVQCHGPDGSGIGEDFPPLAGQPARYLQDQLEAWRSGKRSGDPMGLMEQVAKSLDGDDLAPVADYFASLPSKKGADHE